MPAKTDYMDKLQEKIKHLNEAVWERRITQVDIQSWLDQFDTSSTNLDDDEQLHAMYLLSEFIYFGQIELRELLKSIYRDLFRAPILHEIRRANGNTSDTNILSSEFEKRLQKTRFMGVGNPSESGAYLLYYFRQENALPKTLFMNTHEIFKREGGASGGVKVRHPDMMYYVFIDDLCGSGTQGWDYSVDLIEPLKREKPNAKAFYFVLFGTTEGLEKIRSSRCFDKVAAVYELDKSFKSLEIASRLFQPEESPFLRAKIRTTCEKYGTRVWPSDPLGYKDGQLLLAFNHNTPDNTLPIFWADGTTGAPWTPIFKRYHKDYG